MANTIDNFTLKVNVEGTAQIKTTTADIQNLDKATTTAGKNMGAAAQNIRNVGFQVQDFAVQVSNGTSAITALSQQLPQLLSGFGTLGIYIGVVAAALPAAIALYKTFGGDTRNLDERIKDLTDSVKEYQTAQRTNITTTQALGTTFGGLADDAKRLYEYQERLTKFKARFQLIGSIQELKDEYKTFTSEFLAEQKKVEENPYIAQAGGFGRMTQLMKQITSGLNQEQLKFVADAVKNIDVNKPEETAATFERIRNYLEESGVSADNFQKFLKNTLDPILRINEAFIEFNRNVKEAGDRMVKVALDTADLQQKFLPQIGDAKRRFDLIGAARLETEYKIQGEILKLRDRTDLTEAQKALMLLSIRRQGAIDLANAEKDIVKQQYESAFALVRQNEARTRQLAVEAGIVQLRDRGLFDSEWNLKYEEELLKVDQVLADTLSNIEELRRKNQISQKQALTLEQQAFDLQRRGADIAAQRRDADVRKKIIQDEMDLNKKNVEEQISARQTLDDLIRQTIDKVRESQMTPDARALTGLTSIQQKFVEIEAAARRAALEKGRVFAAKFEGDMTPERMAELARGLDQITEAERKWAEQQKELAKANYDFTRQFESGWLTAFTSYAENANDASKKAQTYFNTFSQGVEQLFLSILPNNQWSWRNFLNAMLADFLRFQAQLAVTQLAKPGGLVAGLFGGGLKSLFGGIGFGTGMGFGNLDYGGFFAKGGTLGAGKWGIAGEAGPEMITGPATITPMSQAPSTTIVNYNISAVDAQSFRTMVARDPQFIYSVTEAGRRAQPTRRLS